MNGPRALKPKHRTVAAPVDVCGSSVAVLGDSAASCEGAASAGAPGHGHKPSARHW